MKNLRNTEKVKIGKHEFILSSIPAIQAQRMLLGAFSAFSTGDIGALPQSLIDEMLSYTAVINPNGAEVQFENEELVEMMIDDPVELIELESRMVEKNFGFLGDGRLKDAVGRLTGVFGKAADTATQNI